MTMKKISAELIKAAQGEFPIDLLLKNAQVINVFSGEIYRENVAIWDKFIVGFGDYEAKKTIDLDGLFLAPGFNARMVTAAQVSERLKATRDYNETKDHDNRLFNLHVDKLIDALTAAGFPGFYDGYKGLDMSKARVVQWIKDNGHTLPPTTKEV